MLKLVFAHSAFPLRWDGEVIFDLDLHLLATLRAVRDICANEIAARDGFLQIGIEGLWTHRIASTSDGCRATSRVAKSIMM